MCLIIVLVKLYFDIGNGFRCPIGLKFLSSFLGSKRVLNFRCLVLRCL